jgi:ubiquinone/menaquinone biosynthesis C-methylase UbiE
MLPLLYDLLMRPLEALALHGWRDRTWSLLPSGGRGLEVGAGTGANVRFYPASAPVVAIDRSWAMLRRARRKSPRSLLVAADVHALPFRDACFDWTAGTLVFCEVADPIKGFREIGRVSKPGAPLVLLEHVRPGGWAGRVAEAVTRLTGPLFGERFDRRTAALLRASGWRVRKVEWMWRDVVALLEAVKCT